MKLDLIPCIYTYYLLFQKYLLVHFTSRINVQFYAYQKTENPKISLKKPQIQSASNEDHWVPLGGSLFHCNLSQITAIIFYFTE